MQDYRTVARRRDLEPPTRGRTGQQAGQRPQQERLLQRSARDQRCTAAPFGRAYPDCTLAPCGSPSSRLFLVPAPMVGAIGSLGQRRKTAARICLAYTGGEVSMLGRDQGFDDRRPLPKHRQVRVSVERRPRVLRVSAAEMPRQRSTVPAVRLPKRTPRPSPRFPQARLRPRARSRRSPEQARDQGRSKRPRHRSCRRSHAGCPSARSGP